MGNPLREMVWLDLVLKGVQRAKPKGSHPRLPITPRVLRIIKRSIDVHPGFDSTMLRVALLSLLDEMCQVFHPVHHFV